MGKSFLTEYRLELSALLTLVFAFLSVIGLVGVRYIHNSNGAVTFDLPGSIRFLQDLIQPFGEWVTWIAVIAPIGLLVGAWWLYDYVRKSRKLVKLIDTTSRAKFVKNMDDIEYMAWVLPRRFEVLVLDKKKEFKL